MALFIYSSLKHLKNRSNSPNFTFKSEGFSFSNFCKFQMTNSSPWPSSNEAPLASNVPNETNPLSPPPAKRSRTSDQHMPLPPSINRFSPSPAASLVNNHHTPTSLCEPSSRESLLSQALENSQTHTTINNNQVRCYMLFICRNGLENLLLDRHPMVQNTLLIGIFWIEIRTWAVKIHWNGNYKCSRHLSLLGESPVLVNAACLSELDSYFMVAWTKSCLWYFLVYVRLLL